MNSEQISMIIRIICRPEHKKCPSPEGSQLKITENLKINQPGVKFDCPFEDLANLNNLMVSNSTCCEVFIQVLLRGVTYGTSSSLGCKQLI